jgi:hypothetical protein
MTDIAPTLRISKTAKIGIAFVVLLFWSFAAGDWEKKGCTLPQGYGFVLMHGGWPEPDEGCEIGYGDHPEYTTEYRG